MITDFSRVLASIDDAGDRSLHVVVPPDWLQGRTVFGGMQMAIAVRGIVLSRVSRSSSVDAARHPNHRLSSAFACELVPQALLAASQTAPCAAFDGLLRRIIRRKISDTSSRKYVQYVSLHRLTLSVTLRKAR